MSDVPVTPFGERDPGEVIDAALNPENLMDILDPGQHFQGEFYTEEKVQEELERVKGVEKAKIEAEKKTAAAKKLEAQRKARKSAASRSGRRASMVSGPLGAKDEANVRRATLGGQA